MRGGINWEFRINIYTLLYIKQMNNKNLLYSTRNYIHYLVITSNGKESEKKGTSLVVLWVRLHAYNAGGPGRGTRSRMHATTKDPACCNEDPGCHN